MDRDPLHDSVLEEASMEAEDTDEGNASSAPTSPMTAAERAPLPDHVPPHAPPYGPPPPQPVNAPSTMAHFRARRTEPSAGSTSTSAGVDSMGIAATWPTRAPYGEAGDAPRWHRTLAANILHHLQLTGPAYVRAPEYAEVATWRSLLISLREATPAEEYMLARTDPQDLNNAVYDDNVDNGVHEAGGVETAPESEGRTDDPNTSEADSESDRDRTATRPPSATIAPALATTSIIAAMPPPSGHLPPDDSADSEPDASGTLYESEDGWNTIQIEVPLASTGLGYPSASRLTHTCVLPHSEVNQPAQWCPQRDPVQCWCFSHCHGICHISFTECFHNIASFGFGSTRYRGRTLRAQDVPSQFRVPQVGHHVLPMPQHPPEDAQDLVDLYRTFDLVESQIDFLWVRRRDATSQAKQAYAMRSFHVGRIGLVPQHGLFTLLIERSMWDKWRAFKHVGSNYEMLKDTCLMLPKRSLVHFCRSGPCKKVLSCLVGPYIPQMLAAIQQFPQYAYQQGRAQYDALRRAFKHCASVREELGHHRRDLHARKAGHRPTPLFGALMLTLDLSQAFDRMPRHHLLQGMRDLQLPDSLVAVLMQWHSQIRYTVHHAGQSCTFPASRGIRQGCSASPLLWLVFSHVLCTQLATRIGKHKVDQILTVFADDHFAADSFHSLPEFEALLDCIVALFCTLEAFGMEVSDAKSKAVLALRGTLSNTITRRYVRKVPGGKVLRIQLRNRVLAIPLVSQFTYLGAQVSYQAFENQTLQYRLEKGTATYNRLGSVLKGRHHLTAAQRIDLWKSCVWSSISYALPACGLTPSGHKTLETAVIKHLRAILRSPVHLTFTSNAEIAQQAGLELPHRMLQKLLQTEARRKSNASSPVDPFICTPADSWWTQVEESLQPPAESTTIQVPSLTVAKCACPICGITYALRSALLTHVAKQHPESLLELEQPTFDRAVDAIGGMPQCAACGKRFSTWQLLQRHVEGNYCAAKHELLPAAPIEPIVPASKRPALFAESPWPDLVKTYASRAIYHFKANEVYLQHCLVCGQWVASHKAMKLHYRRTHAELFRLHNDTAHKLCQSYPRCSSPCHFCKAKLAQPKAHNTQCTVLWQFCISYTAAHRNGGPTDPRDLRASGPGGSGQAGHSSHGGHVGQRSSVQAPQDGQAPEGALLRAFRRGLRPPLQGAESTRSPGQGGSFDQGDGQIGDTPRDPIAGPEAKLCLDPLLEAGPSRGHADSVQSCSHISRSLEDQVHGSSPPGGPAEHPVSDSAYMPAEPGRATGSANSGQNQRLAEQRGQMGISTLGPREPDPHDRRLKSSSDTPRDRQSCYPVGDSSDGKGRDSSLQCDERSTGQSRANHDFPLGSGTEGHGSREGLGSPRVPIELDGPTAVWHATQTGQSQEELACQRRAEIAAGIHRLCLINRSQHCYANSFAFALLWCHQLLKVPEAQLFGTKVQAWRDVLYHSTSVSLFRLQSWASLWRGWERPSAQHDECILPSFCTYNRGIKHCRTVLMDGTIRCSRMLSVKPHPCALYNWPGMILIMGWLSRTARLLRFLTQSSCRFGADISRPSEPDTL
ncbi:unnamed protein product [Symbiodinium sp. CCMP2592]|nr:unnamed protein product [Symbiodinium sp. CCMP2592]